MNITLCSSFRNSTGYIDRYFAMVATLNHALCSRGDALKLVLGEGDSTDGTLEHLKSYFEPSTCEIIDCTHGGEVFGSVVDAQRFKQLAHVATCIWEHMPEDSDAVLWVESDLIWEAEDMVKLIDRLKEYPAVSPMVMLQREGYPDNYFYDVWAFRIHDGKPGQGNRQFRSAPPYFNGWPVDKPFMLDSAGSCMALRAELARKLVWDERVFPGVCEQIYEQGGSVWVDPGCVIIHE